MFENNNNLLHCIETISVVGIIIYCEARYFTQYCIPTTKRII